jgi:hypothetical protein
MEKPTFVLYAGRKANPLGLPLMPTIVRAETLAEALRKRPPQIEVLDGAEPFSIQRVEVAHDRCDGFGSGLLPPFRREVRRDAAPDRGKWQFRERVVEIGILDFGA